MTAASIPDDRSIGVIESSTSPANCAANPAHRGRSIGIRRMMGLETAAAMLGGQGPLAVALGIEPRSLRAKLSADRGVSDADLLFAAAAIETRAAKLLAHAQKLRDEVAVDVAAGDR